MGLDIRFAVGTIRPDFAFVLTLAYDNRSNGLFAYGKDVFVTSWQLLIAHAVKVLVLLTLAGILVRHRARLCWSFTAYLGAILVCNSLASFWPERFVTDSFWTLKQALYDVLKMVIAVELTYRAFRAFPGAQAMARRVLFALLVLTSAVLVGLPRDPSYPSGFLEWEPRVLLGTIWLLNGVALLVIWYRVPLHRYHKAILLGFVPYLLVFVALLRMLRHYGWDILPLIQSAEPAAYLLLVGWWAYVAWEPEAAPDVSPAVLQRLQPWSARS